MSKPDTSCESLDFDSLLDILSSGHGRVSDKLDNVEFVTVRDKMKAGYKWSQIDGKPKAWITAIKLLDNWKYDDVDLGKLPQTGILTAFLSFSLSVV